MSARSQRGRPTPTKKSGSLLPFYVLLAVIAVVGVVLVTLTLNQVATPTTTAPGAAPAANVNTATLASYPSKGSASAPLTVVEYADFQCPGCAAYATQQEAQIRRDYIDNGKVRFIYHELPIPSHGNAYVSAEAARAAGEQGKYWDMHDLLFARQNDWAELPNDQAKAKFGEYAKELGLDVAAFTTVLDSGKYRPVIEQAYNESVTANIQYTPSFVVGGKIYQSDQLKGALDAALAAK